MIRIKELRVENFRALKDLEIKLHPMTTVIGENDVGKSSLMLALRTFFEVRKIDRLADVFMKDPELAITISVALSIDTPNESQAVYVNDGGLKLRARYSVGEPRAVEVFSRMPKDERFANFASMGAPELKKLLVEVTGEKTHSKLNKVETKEQLKKWISDNVTEFTDAWVPLEEREFEKLVPDFVLVPVSRDMESNVKMTDSSLFGKLFKPLLRASMAGTEFERSLSAITVALAESVETTVMRLEELMRGQMNNPAISLTHTVDLDPIKGIEFEFGMDDERAQGIPLTNRGAGVHNNLILGMFRLLAEQRATDFILAIEEPENSLHPRGQREMLWALQALSKTAQVVCTTHSSVFLDLGSLEDNIVLTRTPHGNTIARQFSPDNHEALREIMGIRISDALLSGGGNCAIIVEGQTELHAYPWLFKLAGLNHRELGISIVPANCSDSETIRSLLRVLECYGIPVIVVLDKDAQKTAEDLSRSIGAGGYRNLKQVFCLTEGQFERYIPLDLAMEIINDRYPEGELMQVTDLAAEKDREKEFQRLMFEKKGPGARFAYFKVIFGELAGKAMFEGARPLPDDFKSIIEAAHEIATTT